MLFPPPLRPGDRIAVVAPSGAFDAQAARAGIAWLSSRYRVRHRASIFARDGYLAGPDPRRAAELQSALDGDCAAVVAVRGGYGLSRIVPALEWRGFMAAPKWLVGFSDFSALHLEAWTRGFASVHANMVGGLALAGAQAQEAWIDALERPRRARSWEALTCLRAGRARGVLVGGNLAMLHDAAAARRLALPRRAILVLEDIGERPYRVDRMLTSLIAGGHLRGAAAVVLGDFTACASGPDGRAVEDVLAERLRLLRVPLLAGLPVGHGSRNDPLILGARVEVTAGRRGSALYTLP